MSSLLAIRNFHILEGVVSVIRPVGYLYFVEAEKLTKRCSDKCKIEINGYPASIFLYYHPETTLDGGQIPHSSKGAPVKMGMSTSRCLSVCVRRLNSKANFFQCERSQRACHFCVILFI